MPTEYAQDRRQLAQFFEDLTAILRQLAMGELYRLLPRHLDYTRPAWRELEARETIHVVMVQIAEGDQDNALTDQRLASAGLIGDQLALKLAGFGHWRERLRRILQSAAAPFSPGGVVDRIIQKLLKWANVILKSIASAIPGAHPIVEMKESLEAAIEEAIEEEELNA